jgi:pyruvate dehydrogenase E1 component alpha subunit
VSLTGPRRVDAYRRILRIRRFEEAVLQQLRTGAIPGAVHLSIGHEGAIVGACLALRDDDFILGTHRSHGHPIAKGAALAPLMAELMGKKTGICRGRGGSMHLAHHAVGVVGESGIVGGGIALATGAGLSASVRGTDQVSLCFFGDGASSEGVFHESLNMASIWKLPVVFFCENNLYGATTPARRVLAVESVAARAAGYAMPGRTVDGQDVEAVYAAVEHAVARARSGDGPSLVEARTYRYGEHAEGVLIPVVYRAPEEVERWKARDPLGIQRARLLEAGLLDAEGLASLEAEVEREVEAAVRFARESDFPDASEAYEDVFAPAPPASGPGAGTGGAS